MSRPNGPDAQFRKDNDTSDSSQSEVRYLAIGRVIRAHALRGEISVQVLTEFPERFETTEWLYLGDQFEATPYRLQGYRWHKKNVLLTLKGVTDRTEAELLRGLLVQVPLDEAVPLPEGSYYIFQVIGLQVYTTNEDYLGVVDDVLETGANDVYIVKNEESELLLPAIPEVIKNVDLDAGTMTIEMMEGLI